MLNIPEAVKALFKTDGVQKNFRVHFPGGEYRDLVNADIVADSVSFTESVCSKTVLQFGLAEASRIEFECVGVPNIYGATIECYCEIDATSLDAEYQTVKSDVPYPVYQIPYGVFRVQSCPRSAGAMSHRRVEAYALDAVGTAEMSKLLSFKLNTPSIASTMMQNIPLLLAGEYNDISGLSVTETTESFTGGRMGLYSYRLGWKNGNVACFVSLPNTPIPTWDSYDITSEKDAVFRFTCDYSVTGADELLEALRALNAPDHIVQTIIGWYTGGVQYSIYGNRSDKRFFAFGNPEDSGYFYPYAPNFSGGSYINLIGYPTSTLTFSVYDGSTSTSYPVTPSVTNAVLKKYALSTSIDTVLKSTSNTNYSGTTETGDYYTYTDALDLVGLKEGMLELNAQFGQTSREGLPKKVTLSQSSPISMSTAEYSEMWWDEYSISPIGSIKYTYHDADLNQEQTMIYSFDAGLSEYDMTSNYLLKNLSITKADAGMELYEYVQGLLDTYFIPNISDIYFTPVDLSAMGLPYLEAGDYLEIDAGDGTTVGTYILSRTLNGEQYLTDDIQSQGGEIIGSTVRSA